MIAVLIHSWQTVAHAHISNLRSLTYERTQGTRSQVGMLVTAGAMRYHMTFKLRVIYCYKVLNSAIKCTAP